MCHKILYSATKLFKENPVGREFTVSQTPKGQMELNMLGSRGTESQQDQSYWCQRSWEDLRNVRSRMTVEYNDGLAQPSTTGLDILDFRIMRATEADIWRAFNF